VLYGFQLCCTVLCGLVLACGSAVVWRSSRSLRGYPLLVAIYLVTKPNAVKIGPSLGPFLQRSLSCGNQSNRCYGTFLDISHHPTLYHLLYHFVYVLQSTKKPYKKSYSHFVGTVTLCHAFITLLVTAFVLPPYSCLILICTPHRLFGVCC
jgi:hypothetical protein